MYQVLEATAFPAVEPYSIDEMFLDMRGLNDLARAISHARSGRKCGVLAKIPTCVGIGPTKTIAKLANGVGKGHHADIGVCDMSTPEQRAKLYRDIPLGEVWGMGGQSVKKLAKLGIETVADFVGDAFSEEVRKDPDGHRNADPGRLRGQSCLQNAVVCPTAWLKMLAVTRSFGRTMTDKIEMRQAVATYAEIAGRRLRAAREWLPLVCRLFLMTNRFRRRCPNITRNRPSQSKFSLPDTMALNRVCNSVSGPDVARRLQVHQSGNRPARPSPAISLPAIDCFRRAIRSGQRSLMKMRWMP